MLKLAKSEQLFQLLKDRIGQMKDGERFPSVRQLMQEYNVSQFTVGPALDLLEERKLLIRKVGKGTFVRKNGEQKQYTVYYYMNDWNFDEASRTERICHKIAQERNYNYRRIIYHHSEDVYSQLPFGEADAIIINPSRSDLSQAQLNILKNAPIPIIMIRATLHQLGLNCVGGHNVVAGTMAAEYFLKNGHRKMAILLSEPFSYTSNEIFDGYSSRIKAEGGELTVIDCKTRFGENSQMKAFTELSRYLESNHADFTAMFVASDYSALGALRALSEFNINVPEQLSVLGFGGNISVALFKPSLSSIVIPLDKMADGAFDLIDQALKEKKLHGLTHIVYPEFIERESTATPVETISQ
jgi:DNA-binding LacI/PurR family transcriptional regulator